MTSSSPLTPSLSTLLNCSWSRSSSHQVTFSPQPLSWMRRWHSSVSSSLPLSASSHPPRRQPGLREDLLSLYQSTSPPLLHLQNRRPACQHLSCLLRQSCWSPCPYLLMQNVFQSQCFENNSDDIQSLLPVLLFEVWLIP